MAKLSIIWTGLLLSVAATCCAADFQMFTNVLLAANPGNDGDSFRVAVGDKEHVVRLYFVDCPETGAGSKADARRIREQSRYFGLGDAATVARFGLSAAEFTRKHLSEPFTLITSFASAPGRSSLPRVYAFVQTSKGNDLASVLVANGLARMHGLGRETPGGVSRDETKERLRDLEISAMLKRTGIWAESNADRIVELRAAQRREDAEFQEIQTQLKKKSIPLRRIDINKASREELEMIDGIGPKLAERIIELRPYVNVDSLQAVKGIGPAKLDSIRTQIIVTNWR